MQSTRARWIIVVIIIVVNAIVERICIGNTNLWLIIPEELLHSHSSSINTRKMFEKWIARINTRCPENMRRKKIVSRSNIFEIFSFSKDLEKNEIILSRRKDSFSKNWNEENFEGKRNLNSPRYFFKFSPLFQFFFFLRLFLKLSNTVEDINLKETSRPRVVHKTANNAS